MNWRKNCGRCWPIPRNAMRWCANSSPIPTNRHAMRLLMKIPVPTPAENPLVGDPMFENKLSDLYRRIGALAHYSNRQDGRRLEYVLVDIDPGQITPTAEQVVH